MLIFAAIAGLIFGSFCNVLIIRAPLGVSLFWPPSSCPKCARAVKFYDNIPVFSWLFLRGKCRGCAQPISCFYPIFELICSGIFVFSFYCVYEFDFSYDAEILLDIFTLDALLLGVAMSLLLSLCVMDLRHFAVPEGTLLLTLAIFAYLYPGGDFSNLHIACVCMGVAVICKAFFELILNLKAEFASSEPAKILQLDFQHPWIFRLILLVFFVLLAIDLDYFPSSFFYALAICAQLYLLISVIGYLINKLLAFLKIKRKMQKRKIRLYKEVFGSADIEMVGILALVLGSYSQVMASVFAAAILMLIFHFAAKFSRSSSLLESSKRKYALAFAKDAKAPDTSDLPEGALPFFPFLVLGLMISLVFPEFGGFFSA